MALVLSLFVKFGMHLDGLCLEAASFVPDGSCLENIYSSGNQKSHLGSIPIGRFQVSISSKIEHKKLSLIDGLDLQDLFLADSSAVACAQERAVVFLIQWCCDSEAPAVRGRLQLCVA
jgi:hypothetical protein